MTWVNENLHRHFSPTSVLSKFYTHNSALNRSFKTINSHQFMDLEELVSTGSPVSVASQTTAITWCWPEKQPAALLIVILTTLVTFKEYLLHFSYVYGCFPVSAKVGIVFFVCLFLGLFFLNQPEKKKKNMSKIFDCSCLNRTRGHIHEHFISPVSQKKKRKTHNRCNTTHISLFMLNFNDLK